MKTFKKKDLLCMMTVTLRCGHVEVLYDGFDPIYALVDLDDYNENLLCTKLNRPHPSLDIMRVALPSGTVLWERPTTRIFSRELLLQHADQTNWDRSDPVLQVLGDTLDGKEVQFIGAEESTMVDGIRVSIKWTRLAEEGDK